MDFKDYYKTLGVQPNADIENIRNAYRKLSKKFHPDVNNGDKFFEEKFKEIQEAYEMLCDASKRKQYDFNRANFKKSNNFKQEHEDYLRKKEEELKKQKEDFKKWEEFLKKKEEALTEKEKQKVKQTKKPLYAILLLILIAISVSLIYLTAGKKRPDTINSTINNQTIDTPIADVGNDDNFKYPVVRTKVLNGKAYQKDSRGDWYEMQSSLAENIDGKWTGSAFQYDVKESWTIKFTCNSKEETFLIEYPSLGCNGTLSIENITDSEIEFKENIQEGQGICNNNGKIKLRIISSKKLAYLYYLPNSSVVNAEGQITKE